MRNIIMLAIFITITSCSSQSQTMNSRYQVEPQSNETNTASRPAMLCDSKPNCVSSQELRQDHQVAPFILRSSTISLTQIEAVALTFPRTQTISKQDDYLHITFTSLIFRFTDDVEMVKQGNVIHIRSRSRVSYSDFGVNRERVEKLRRKLVAENLIAP